MPIIDAYAHVSLPRFLSTEDCLRLMDRHRIESAVLSTADTCPDVQELSRAIVTYPDRFRALGMPTGATPARVRDAIRAQLDSGFSGIRLPAALIAGDPGLLDLIGAAGAIALVVGDRGLAQAARSVADFLDRYPACAAIAGHFGGPADPGLLDADAAVGRLFDHPRLFVAFTRHGALGHLPVEAWASALVRRVGWDRLIWGSEWPVALWRNETYRSTLDWALRFAPDAGQLGLFFGGNAQRLFFGRPSAARPIGPEWDLLALRRRADVWLFPPSLDVSEEQHRRLMLAYEAWGGESRGRYSEFFLTIAERGLRAAEGDVPGSGP
jgi:predicted TIM-barrel fold metal-dependent hydrolase